MAFTDVPDGTYEVTLGFTENGWAVRRSFIVEAANGKGDHDRGTAIHRGHHGFGGDKAGLSRPLGAPFAY